jgi:lipopolysaccharide transport system ATP-binding protein
LVSIRGLGKSYPVHNSPGRNAGDLLRLLSGRPVERAAVLQGIDFNVLPRESLGIIGENGAGKSTLLKLISGVLRPSEGSVTRRGSVGALLELGAGFDRDLTGRQNIALSAGLQGWSAGEVREREEHIIAFADIGRYIDEPIKHYSSGMVVRLGFAIIAAVRPDLLITDEVLAVGDESFQKKCIRWIEDYLGGGGTLLFVSHSMYHIQKLCQHALWLRGGRVAAYGDVFDVTRDYLAYHERRVAEEQDRDNCRTAQAAELRLVDAALNGEDSEVPAVIDSGGRLQVDVSVESPGGQPARIGLGLVRADGTAIFGTTSEIDGAQPVAVDGDRVRYRVVFDALPLLPGSYSVRLHSMDYEGIRVFDTLDRAFTVRGRLREVGIVNLAHRWE